MRLRPLAALLALALASAAPALADPVPMAAHRALYRLALENGRGEVSAAIGTMAFEVIDACDGWATRQRLEITITNRDGQDIEMVSDYATWESKDGLSMRFRMRQTTDTAVTEQTEGDAQLDAPGGPGRIRYTSPTEQTVPLPAGTLFPMAHTVAIMAAAEQGQRFLSLPIFDGTSDKGPQDSSVAITSWGNSGDAPYPPLASLANGRVRIAFFDRSGGTRRQNDRSMGSPEYEIGMRYWANGVADDLHMDFTDFLMQGRLSEFTLVEPHC